MFVRMSHAKSPFRGTYPDKNGKRRFSEFAFARAHGLAPRKTVRTWGAVAETP